MQSQTNAYLVFSNFARSVLMQHLIFSFALYIRIHVLYASAARKSSDQISLAASKTSSYRNARDLHALIYCSQLAKSKVAMI